MTAVTPAFEAAHPGVKPRFNYGSSGQLRVRIENGAPADVYIAAGIRDMDSLEAKGLIEPGTRQIVAENTLVLVRGRSAPPPLLSRAEDLLRADIARVAIGNPATVPAGRYAREALEKRGLTGKTTPDAALFVDFLRSKTASRMFRHYGFD